MNSSHTPHQLCPLNLGDRCFEFGHRTYIVGIINMTPDSFSGDGLRADPEAARRRGEAMIEAGADLLDVGGESTRPGSLPVSCEEEMARVVPAVYALAQLGVPVSIDTRKARVARAAIEAGACMVNDISALTADPDMAPVVADSGAALCLMHMQGTPETMQQDPRYGDDVVGEVADYLRQRCQEAEASGIAPDRIVVDPGIGFGKRLEDNLRLTNELDVLRWVTGRPVLIGPSRKSFIGQILDLPGGRPPAQWGAPAPAPPMRRRAEARHSPARLLVEERLEGTAAAVAVAIARGADFVRVHDVRAMARVARVADALTRRSP